MTASDVRHPPLHLAIIPDGTRRAARRDGVAYEVGYARGADRALSVVEWCVEAGIRTLSAFGVSTENIAARPRDEILAIHGGLVRFCRMVLADRRVCLNVFGALSDLPAWIPQKAELLEAARQRRTDATLMVNVGVNYSAQADVGHWVSSDPDGAPPSGPPGPLLSQGIPWVDLIVRTGGRRSLSGFLPLQAAYAELWLTNTLWPDFGHHEMTAVFEWYGRQDRTRGE